MSRLILLLLVLLVGCDNKEEPLPKYGYIITNDTKWYKMSNGYTSSEYACVKVFNGRLIMIATRDHFGDVTLSYTNLTRCPDE